MSQLIDSVTECVFGSMILNTVKLVEVYVNSATLLLTPLFHNTHDLTAAAAASQTCCGMTGVTSAVTDTLTGLAGASSESFYGVT